ncbi:MAG: sigma-70 family RNA polymerase sigma factor [Chitinophagaceae bacterium]|nr:MAG: sigma-70 family RNA polymerase sigma factor [Chitinophagaceae bacterium]
MAPNSNIQEFESLFTDQYSLLFGRAWRLVSQKDKAAGLVRIAFQDVFANWSAFANRDQIVSYLHANTMKMALDYLNNQRDPALSPLKRLVPKVRLDVVDNPVIGSCAHGTLCNLMGNQRAAFVLHRFEKLNHQTIALQLNCSALEVRELISTAVADLTKCMMEDRGIDPQTVDANTTTAFRQMVAGVGTPGDQLVMTEWAANDPVKMGVAARITHLEQDTINEHAFPDLAQEWEIIREGAGLENSTAGKVNIWIIALGVAVAGAAVYFFLNK